MRIRKVEARDKEELAKLILRFHDHTQNFLSKKQAQIREYNNPQKVAKEKAEEYLSSEYLCFVADENGLLTGFVTGEIKEKKGRVYDKEGWVKNWYVDEGHRGKGIGEELFHKLEEEFKKEGCTHVGLDTHLENKKAIKIYEHLGFNKRLVTFFKPLKDLDRKGSKLSS